jgi:hypothetical protein
MKIEIMIRARLDRTALSELEKYLTRNTSILEERAQVHQRILYSS